MTLRQVDIHQAVAFCCHKQHISPGSHAKSITEVATSLVGIHAARLVTPFFALRARLPKLDYREIDAALHRDKTLIKARCMRGTLHLLPPELFPHAHRATLTKRIGVCKAILKKLNIGQPAVLEMAETILRLLQDGPLSSAVIEQRALAFIAARERAKSKRWTVAGVRAVVKELWESAELCYINSNVNFASETRLYGITAKTYPAFSVTNDADDMAIQHLVDRHIQAYGPVTMADIAWWSGIDRTRIKRAVEQLGDRVTAVAIRESAEPFWIAASDREALLRFTAPTEDWVAILAHEDPSLKGYYSSRWRYITQKNYGLLFNDIGESRPAIMLNGRVVGIWNLDKASGSISQSVFEPITGKQRKLIEAEFKRVRSTLPPLRERSELHG